MLTRQAYKRLTFLSCAIGASCLALAACEEPAPKGPAAVDQQRILNADAEPGNWMAHGRDFYEQRFSPLDQINDKNAGELGLAWYYDLETHRGVEATPIVVDGVIYNISAWNVTTAVDARTGKELWKYDPEVPTAWGRYGCCDVISRGLAVWNGKAIIATFDGRLIGLDAKTGTPVWETLTIDRDWPYTITGAPRVFNGKVVIGNGGADFGVRGYVTAYDAETGKQLWRFYTVPGDPSKGPDGAASDSAMEMAAKTWNGEWWKIGGGGTVWDSIVYDPDFNRVYLGTGNGSPWVQDYRSPGGGDNLFLASIIAVDADTGEYVWHYQEVPGEQWDYTSVQPMMLANLEIEGKPRKVLMHAPKNGFFYVIDRETGKLISAEKFAPNTWASHVDMETGRPVLLPDADYGEEPVLMTPGAGGAHNFNPMAYSPLTGLVYFPAQELWTPYSKDPNFDPNNPPKFRWNSGNGGSFSAERAQLMEVAASREKGWLTAWDPVKQREAWRVDYPRPGNSGVLATAGNLLVQGTAMQTFRVYRADNGELLFETPIQTMPIAAPVTYTVDGEQFIAINAGWGGGMGMFEVRTGKDVNRSDARLLAFKLGGTAALPPLPDAPAVPPPPAVTAPEDVIGKGGGLYASICAPCHGINAIGGGVIKDLRHMEAATHDNFKAIVMEGAMESLGMVSFADVLSEEDADAIHAYLIARANEDWGKKEEPHPAPETTQSEQPDAVTAQ